MSGKVILVADDERALANALNLKLTKEGFKVATVFNGRDCIDYAKNNTVDLCLLDLMMPDVDGFAVLTAFKALPIFPPTVVLSNLSQEEDVDKVKKLGAKEYFVKSNTPIRDIVAYVIKLLHESPE